eukprot:TRINITY_DN24115_c0_g1_i1.p1 TRINITY_DN24115_c0_g1~~TRINITY_DN24115_c0_g1_i1.p1  ORF type:complete len:290 (+),score=24.12 TRINITY_DN24115_c0_g1_i1:31-870(+)
MVLTLEGGWQLPGKRYIHLFVDIPAFLAYLQRLNASYNDVMVMAGQVYKNDKGSREQIEVQEFAEQLTIAGKRYISLENIIQQVSQIEELNLEVRVLASRIKVPRTKTTYVDVKKQKKQNTNLYSKLQHQLQSQDYQVPSSYISMRKCPPPDAGVTHMHHIVLRRYQKFLKPWQYEEDYFARRYLEKNPDSVFSHPMDLTSDQRPYVSSFARRWAELCREGMDKTEAYKQVEKELTELEQKEKMRNAAVPQTPMWVRVQQEEQKQLDRAMRQLEKTRGY